jgi:hypothetical protein
MEAQVSDESLMGLLVSICPHCFKTVEWFFTAPKACKKCNGPLEEANLFKSTGIGFMMSHMQSQLYFSKKHLPEEEAKRVDELLKSYYELIR